MDERLQFVARRLAGEAMAELCREFADLPQDRLQDLRSLPGMWRSRADRQEQASLSLCPATSLSGGELYPEREARAHHLGCP